MNNCLRTGKERVESMDAIKKDIERLNAIYERLSESGRIMMLAYSTGLRDKEMVESADEKMRGELVQV